MITPASRFQECVRSDFIHSFDDKIMVRCDREPGIRALAVAAMNKRFVRQKSKSVPGTGTLFVG